MNISDPDTMFVLVCNQVRSCYVPPHRFLFSISCQGARTSTRHYAFPVLYQGPPPSVHWLSHREVDVLMKKYGGKKRCERAWNMAFRWNGT